MTLAELNQQLSERANEIADRYAQRAHDENVAALAKCDLSIRQCRRYMWWNVLLTAIAFVTAWMCWHVHWTFAAIMNDLTTGVGSYGVAHMHGARRYWKDRHAYWTLQIANEADDDQAFRAQLDRMRIDAYARAARTTRTENLPC